MHVIRLTLGSVSLLRPSDRHSDFLGGASAEFDEDDAFLFTPPRRVCLILSFSPSLKQHACSVWYPIPHFGHLMPNCFLLHGAGCFFKQCMHTLASRIASIFACPSNLEIFPRTPCMFPENPRFWILLTFDGGTGGRSHCAATNAGSTSDSKREK